MNIALTHVAGRVGDHNNHAMRASPLLANVLARRLGVSSVVLGEPDDALSSSWDEELAAARPLLRQLSAWFDQLLRDGHTPITALGRCAPALATLPVVARCRPDAIVVWFDAHADLNTPDDSTTGYLGGLALSGPLGLWDSGLGDGLGAANVILVGSRDVDTPEQRLIDDGAIALVPVTDDMAQRLSRQIEGRPVYVHVDCDVLEPGTVPTDYLVPDGMTLTQLHECAEALASSEVVGMEIGELEARADPTDPEAAEFIASALEPILRAAMTTGPRDSPTAS